MAKQISFFEKNLLDLDNQAATVTATLGDEFAKFIRTRTLKNAWLTTDSVDADEPYLDIDLGAPYQIDTFIFVDFNFKSYKIELYDSETGIWTEIYSKADETKETVELTFAEFYGQRFKITVLGTQTPDSDKQLNRLLITKKLGSFSYWPRIDSPVIDKGKSARTALSGKRSVLQTVGAFACKLTLENWRNSADLALIESLYNQVQGFQVWLGSGDQDQFFYAAESYRNKDIYLMSFANSFAPKLKDGLYVNGYDLTLDLVESVR